MTLLLTVLGPVKCGDGTWRVTPHLRHRDLRTWADGAKTGEGGGDRGLGVGTAVRTSTRGLWVQRRDPGEQKEPRTGTECELIQRMVGDVSHPGNRPTQGQQRGCGS